MTLSEKKRSRNDQSFTIRPNFPYVTSRSCQSLKNGAGFLLRLWQEYVQLFHTRHPISAAHFKRTSWHRLNFKWINSNLNIADLKSPRTPLHLLICVAAVHFLFNLPLQSEGNSIFPMPPSRGNTCVPMSKLAYSIALMCWTRFVWTVCAVLAFCWYTTKLIDQATISASTSHVISTLKKHRRSKSKSNPCSKLLSRWIIAHCKVDFFCFAASIWADQTSVKARLRKLPQRCQFRQTSKRMSMAADLWPNIFVFSVFSHLITWHL